MIFNKPDYKVYANKNNELLRISEEIWDYDCYFEGFGGKTIVDVGACIGLYSMYAYPFAKVIYAIEPHPTNFQNLKLNIEENNFTKIKPFNLAIAEKNGSGWVTTTGTLEGTFFSFDVPGITVECKTLTTFFNEQNIKYADIVKMDVEAYEYKIFQSPEIQELKDRIGVIILEAHGRSECPFEGWVSEKIKGNIHLLHRK